MNKRKPITIYLFAITSLCILLVSTRIAVSIFSKYYGLVVGIGLMLVAIPLHIAAKRLPRLYILSFLINAIGSGCSVSAYYLMKHISTDLIKMVIAVIPAVIILTLVCIAIRTTFGQTYMRQTILIFVIINVALIILAVVFLIITADVLYSFGFFGLVLAGIYLCVLGVLVKHEERLVLRDISFGSFGAFIILTIVVLTILSEGDMLDGLQFDRKGKKKDF